MRFKVTAPHLNYLSVTDFSFVSRKLISKSLLKIHILAGSNQAG